MAERRLSLEEYKSGLLNADRSVLARAITLIESIKPEDEQLSTSLIESIYSYTGNSFRIGISGIPGVGKSTFLEALGKHLTDQGKKIAILAIDPSSKIHGGSIMGDKTRMTHLVQSPLAFIRPSPSSNTLGGITDKTYETMLLCEAAGFEYIFVETVGVGQSETEVADLTDFFLLLMISGMGDELQVMKKGIMELADAIIINKADGPNKENAFATADEIKQILHIFPSSDGKDFPIVTTCSAKENSGIADIATVLNDFKEKSLKTGHWESKRAGNNVKNLFKQINNALLKDFFNNLGVQQKLKNIENEVAEGKLTPRAAAFSLLNNYKTKK